MEGKNFEKIGGDSQSVDEEERDILVKFIKSKILNLNKIYFDRAAKFIDKLRQYYELKYSYSNNCQLFHAMLLSNTPEDKYREFDFPGEDSVNKWLDLADLDILEAEEKLDVAMKALNKT